MRYPESVKNEMVRKMVSPSSLTPYRLAQDSGIPRGTLSRWLQESGNITSVKHREKQRRPSDWSAEEKLLAVVESASLEGEALGSFLRRKGLHSQDLERWRRQMTRGLEERAKRSRPGKSVEAKRILLLERELRRKESALAEAAALLVLSKKVEALWGDEDVATTGRPGKKSSK
jgi:transposase-like protein